MATQKKIIGKLPVFRGEYNKDVVYYKHNIVTYLGSSFISTKDENMSAPCTVGDKEFILSSGWEFFSDSSEAYFMDERFDEMAEVTVTTDDEDEVNNVESDVVNEAIRKTPQTLSKAEQAQARTNIGAASLEENEAFKAEVKEQVVSIDAKVSNIGSELREEVLRAKEAEEELENNINANRYGYNVTVNGLKGGIHTIETAIKDVPSKFRMLGQKITFRTENGDWATYHNESLSLDNYTNTDDWVQEVGISSVTGDINITNNPDYEDLTEAKDGTIKFADKEYNKESFSGLGRVYLRKNIVEGVNVLTQDMMSKPNTIYIIQYDYDLNGTEITIPEGCVLDFQGGSISNGNIQGNDTIIKSWIRCILNGIELFGTWNVEEALPEWFGAKGDGNNDDTAIIQKTLNVFNKIVFKSPQYLVDIEKGLYPKSNSSILLENTEFVAKPASTVSTSSSTQSVLFLVGVDNVSIIGNGKAVLDGKRDRQPTGQGTNEWSHGIFIKDSTNIKIEGISINNCHGDGICEEKNNFSIIIDKIIADNNFRNGIALTGGEDITVSNCIIKRTDGGNDVGLDIEPDESSYIKNVTVTNCTFNKNGKGISIASVAGEKAAKGEEGFAPNIFNVTVTNCAILNSTNGRGINVGYSVNTNISNCVIQQDEIVDEYSGVRTILSIGTKLSGISIYGAHYGVSSNLDKDITIENCSINNCKRGMQIQNTSGLHLLGNKICNCTLEGVRYIMESNTITSTIVNNKVNNTKGNAIYLLGNNVVVSSNIIHDSKNGILSDRGSNINVINNTIYNSDYGVHFSNCENVDIIGNLMHDNNSAAVYVTDSSNISIRTNKAYNNWRSVVNGDVSYNIDTAEILISKDVDGVIIEGNDISIPHQGCGFAISLLRGSSITNHIVAYNKVADFVAGALNATANLNTLYNIKDGVLLYDNMSIRGGTNRPSVVSLANGTQYFDYNKNKTVFKANIDGKDTWVDALGRHENNLYGSSGFRPVNLNNTTDIGYVYLDETLKRPIWWHGTGWKGVDGNDADAKYAGTFEIKPSNPSIGFAYFCTNRQTPEGTTNGIMIYHKGNDVWVDALGRVVE